MLDRLHGDAVAAERGGVVLAAEVIEVGRDLDPDVGAAETDAVLGRGGLELQADGPAGMQTNPRAAYAALERPPIGHETRAGGMQAPNHGGAR